MLVLSVFCRGAKVTDPKWRKAQGAIDSLAPVLVSQLILGILLGSFRFGLQAQQMGGRIREVLAAGPAGLATL